jgi:hypothetical protein
MPDKNGWIDKSEHRDVAERVLTYSPVEGIRIIPTFCGSRIHPFPAGVTHWQTLPEPPEEEDNDPK